jgi:hypothetical protein
MQWADEASKVPAESLIAACELRFLDSPSTPAIFLPTLPTLCASSVSAL